MCLVLVGEKERNDNASDTESYGGTRLGTYEELKWVKKSNETKEDNIKQHLQQKKEVHCGGEGKVSQSYCNLSYYVSWTCSNAYSWFYWLEYHERISAIN